MINWINNELGEDTVLHLSRYFPRYKQSLPRTSEVTLLEMAEIANEKLNYVYLGNMQSSKYSNTYCPNCKSELIVRDGYNVSFSAYYNGASCSKCQQAILKD